jgi:signal peptidase I
MQSSDNLEPVVAPSVAAVEPIAAVVPAPPTAEELAARRAARRRLLWRAAVELLHDISIAVVFCFFLITFVVQAFRVQGPSMMPLLEDGERIVVNKLVYRMSEIRRGDVVVFWYPHDPSVSYIKRVAALPGDIVELREGELYVNAQHVEEPYVLADYRDPQSNMPPTQVRKGFYFVLGDHRNMSLDSRSWGEVPQKYIYGKALFRFWPLSKMSRIR